MTADEILMDTEERMEKAVSVFRDELRGLRTGRATPALVEHVQVLYYDVPTPLKSIANIMVPESNQLLIKPFSPGDLKAIERAINDSKVGLTPHSDGKQLRLMLPPMSQETRIKMANQCKGFAETAKISIRNARRDANKLVETEEKGGVLTEDEAEKGKEQVQDLTKKYEAIADEVVEKKRKEVMEV